MGSNILLLMVVQQKVLILVFSQEKMSVVLLLYHLYTHLNEEFQRIARRDKKAFLRD